MPMNMILGAIAGLVFVKNLETSCLNSFSYFSPANLNLFPCTPASNSYLPLMSQPFLSDTGQYSPQNPRGMGSPYSCLSAQTLLIESSSALRQKGSMICLILLVISSGVLSIMISLHISSPRASFTGPIAAVKSPTCSNSASVNLFCRFLLGASSTLSDRTMSLSMGMLNCFKALSCSSLLGQPMMMQPLISLSLPRWFISGMMSFRERSSGGGVFGLSSSAFLSFFLVFFGAALRSSTSGDSALPPSSVLQTPHPAGFFCKLIPIWYKMMGRISLALSRPPLEKSLNSDSDRWMEEDRLSKLEGIWDQNWRCLQRIFSRISWMLSTLRSQRLPRRLAMVFLPDLRGPVMKMLVFLGNFGSFCRYFRGRLRKEFRLFSLSKTNTLPAYSAANQNFPCSNFSLESSTQSIKPHGLHFLKIFCSYRPTPSSSFSLPSIFLGSGILQSELSRKFRHSCTFWKLFWTLIYL